MYHRIEGEAVKLLTSTQKIEFDEEGNLNQFYLKIVLNEVDAGRQRSTGCKDIIDNDYALSILNASW